MCGVAGGIFPGTTAANREGLLQSMVLRLVHRGPDDQGIWVDPHSGLGLGHRRLSVIDLTPEGHQPMASPSGRYIIAFNGEIYNFQALKARLESESQAPVWRGHSDTEVLLAAIDAYGIESCLNQLNGMFAFAVVDLQEQVLILARDRMGEKPLYYGTIADQFVFASELASLTAIAPEPLTVDRNALSAYLRVGYVPAPWSIYEGVYKLDAGACLAVPLAWEPGSRATPQQSIRYWDIAKVAAAGRSAPANAHSVGDFEDEFEQKLVEAVRIRMISDVPLGAFLSGGYDSTAVVALMQSQSLRPVKTFSIGFHEKAFDEAVHAKAVAAYLGTEHTELYVTAEQAQAVIPDLPRIYNEPFADPSQIPTFILSRLAREQVTVALSGDGGDELLAGYSRYFWGDRLTRILKVLPLPLQALFRWLLRVPNGVVTGQALEFALSVMPVTVQRRLALQKFQKLANALEGGEVALYKMLMSHWVAPDQVVNGAREVPFALTDGSVVLDGATPVERMMLTDQCSYLPDDILVKVDRASMAVSLESRIPMLDPEFITHAWQLPFSCKYGDGAGKRILKDMVHRYVPKSLMERPKMGFGVPIDQWLRGPLREWAEGLLHPDRLQREGYFNVDQVQRKWREHLSGHYNWQYLIWNVLMFQAWLESTHR